MQLDSIDNNGILSPRIQPSIPRRFLGACWSCITDHAKTALTFLGVTGTLVSVAAKVGNYTVKRIPLPWNITASLGLGAFPMIALESQTWQMQSIKRFRQMSLAQALVLYELLTNIYLNLPQNEDGSPTYPALNEAFLTLMVALAGSFVLMRTTSIFAKRLGGIYTPLRSDSVTSKPDHENPTRLLLEPSSVKAWGATQTFKLALGGGLITAGQFYPFLNPYAKQVGLFVLGHVVGCSLEEGGNALENRLEKVPSLNTDDEDLYTPTSNPKLEALRAGRSLVDTIAALSVGALFTVNKMWVFPVIGGVVGYVKTRTKRDFSKGELPPPLKPVILTINPTCCSIQKPLSMNRQTIITSLFLATVAGWYAWGIDSGVKASKQGQKADFLFVELSAFVGGIGLGAALTGLIQKTKRASLLFNSARFYTGYGSAWLSILTLYLLQQLDRIGSAATQNDEGPKLIAPGAAWGCLGLSVGNSLVKINLNDADPALVTALLTRFLASLYEDQEQL